jgi:5'-nucleotidase
MKILVCNDDGIEADGLWALVEELKQVGQVIVMAPHQEQSGVGTAISLKRAIRVNRVESRLAGVEAYSVEGTPADSVIIALRSLFSGEIDLVVSGINRGSNMGHDVIVSGTLGAAIQGYLHDVPSMAVSLNGYDGELHFEPGAKVAALLATRIRDGMLSEHLLLNINLPNLPLSELEGIEITSQSQQSYCDAVEQDENNRGYYHIKRLPDLGTGLQGHDLWALQQNRISITPLLDGSTANSLQDRLQELALSLHHELRA